MKIINKTIIIGVSAGIAAYKVLDLIKLLRNKGHEIYVIMTEHATRMIHPGEFVKASRNPVQTSLFPDGFDYQEVLYNREVEHIKLADSADIFVIAPATANIIGKIANGIADDYLATTLLASTSPVLICPSMNVNMWQNSKVQENLQKLKEMGFQIITPDKGRLACGYEGVGRLAAPQKIAREIFQILANSNRLKNKKILITAGGTAEPIDAVRVISNRASGKMGIALAEECYNSGADVLLLNAITSVTTHVPIQIKKFETGKELENLVKGNIRKYDAIFHTAAVSDFRPREQFDKKLKSNNSYILHLESTTKILSQIKKWHPKIKLIGFKAVYKLSDQAVIRAGIDKLKVSNSDYIIANDVGRPGVGFGVDQNEVFVVSKKGFLGKIKKGQKREVAAKILDYIFSQPQGYL